MHHTQGQTRQNGQPGAALRLPCVGTPPHRTITLVVICDSRARDTPRRRKQGMRIPCPDLANSSTTLDRRVGLARRLSPPFIFASASAPLQLTEYHNSKLVTGSEMRWPIRREYRKIQKRLPTPARQDRQKLIFSPTLFYLRPMERQAMATDLTPNAKSWVSPTV